MLLNRNKGVNRRTNRSLASLFEQFECGKSEKITKCFDDEFRRRTFRGFHVLCSIDVLRLIFFHGNKNVFERKLLCHPVYYNCATAAIHTHTRTHRKTCLMCVRCARRLLHQTNYTLLMCVCTCKHYISNKHVNNELHAWIKLLRIQYNTRKERRTWAHNWESERERGGEQKSEKEH